MNSNKSLISLIYNNGDNLVNEVSDLIAAGADVNEKTKYSETPLRVASIKSRFDVVKLLFEQGANPEHLKWTSTFHAIAFGSSDELAKIFNEEKDLNIRDTWDRTPFLLAVQVGDIEKVKVLLDSGANLHDVWRSDKNALEFAIQSDNADMLNFLIEQGLDSEKYNDFGYTPLIQACEDNAVNCVKALIDLGVDIFKKDRGQFCREAALSHTRNSEIAKLLISKGADINELSGGNEVRIKLLGLEQTESLSSSEEEYQQGKLRRFGKSNPELCHYKFWYDMVRYGKTAWQAKDIFGEASYSEKPIWCYELYGKSITDLGNGQFIEIGGEHEDHYDPDFCIYNEVFHHKGNGDFDIYMYPKEVFPPTDNHTATLVGKFIYIVGNLGYPANREFGTTPVYRLSTENFSIEKLTTNGVGPGWIYNHIAVLEDDNTICIKEGTIAIFKEEQEFHESNKFDFKLDFNTLEWSKHEAVPLTKEPAYFIEEEKEFSNSNGTVLSFQEGEKWYAYKILDVHRVDVYKGQSISVDGTVVEMPVDDFVFIPFYVKSKSFDSLEALEIALENDSVEFESELEHCRAINFPRKCRYLGFLEVNKEEKLLVKQWKTKFNEPDIISV
jgi:Ankyrin repeats (3 copies)/Ankyrin repeat